jgi:tripartite ATP-independent transporter DctM subunit
VSIAGLLIAGIIPGLIFAGLFAAYVFLRIWRNPSLAPQNEEATPRVEFKDTLIAVGRLLPFTIIIVSVMGLILAGVATPTEAGAMGVLGALMTAAIYRNLSFQMVLESLGGSVKISAMILIIMASSKLFSQLLAFSGGASALTAWIVGLDVSPWLMLVLLMVLPFILCMFIDQIALMLIVIPIYLPIIDSFGYDPIWFWLLFLVNITVGGITPPFGYTLFALKSAWSEGSLFTVFAAAWPFVALFILGMIILAVAPGLTTYLPSKL